MKKSFTIDDLGIEERKVYDELLAQQPQLAKEWEELEKRAGKVRKGVVYSISEGLKKELSDAKRRFGERE